MRSKWPEGLGTAGAEGGDDRMGSSEAGNSVRVDESGDEQARRSRPERGAQAEECRGSGDHEGGGREVREASWMKRARLRRMKRVSAMRVALAELFKPK
jgi:hypothetical protein